MQDCDDAAFISAVKLITTVSARGCCEEAAPDAGSAVLPLPGLLCDFRLDAAKRTSSPALEAPTSASF